MPKKAISFRNYQNKMTFYQNNINERNNNTTTFLSDEEADSLYFLYILLEKASEHEIIVERDFLTTIPKRDLRNLVEKSLRELEKIHGLEATEHSALLNVKIKGITDAIIFALEKTKILVRDELYTEFFSFNVDEIQKYLSRTLTKTQKEPLIEVVIKVNKYGTKIYNLTRTYKRTDIKELSFDRYYNRNFIKFAFIFSRFVEYFLNKNLVNEKNTSSHFRNTQLNNSLAFKTLYNKRRRNSIRPPNFALVSARLGEKKLNRKRPHSKKKRNNRRKNNRTLTQKVVDFFSSFTSP